MFLYISIHRGISVFKTVHWYSNVNMYHDLFHHSLFMKTWRVRRNQFFKDQRKIIFWGGDQWDHKGTEVRMYGRFQKQ